MRLLIVGAAKCAALEHALAVLRTRAVLVREPRVASARLRLGTGEQFDATVLLASTPHCMPTDAAAELAEAGNPGTVVTVAGPWREGRLRFQNAIGDESVVYWHALEGWFDRRFGGEPSPGDERSDAGVVLVNSRDRDAAAAVGDALGDGCRTVIWRPRGGRRPFITKVDIGVWIGGQLSGPALVELATFCREMRAVSARTIALVDFPRADEFVAAEAVGAEAVLAKPWDIDALLAAMPRNIRTVPAVVDDLRRAA